MQQLPHEEVGAVGGRCDTKSGPASRRQSFQHFAEALHAGSTGAPGARGALLTVIDDKAQPAIARASAIDRLGRLLTPATIDAVSRALNDRDAVVRLAAVEALAGTEPATRQRYLARMLDDPVRAVRIEAARALAGASEQGLPPSARPAFDKALAEYIAVQTYNADRPEGTDESWQHLRAAPRRRRGDCRVPQGD